MRVAVVLVALAVLVAASVTGVAGTPEGETVGGEQTDRQASLTFENQTTGGNTVVVREVTLSEGGFVTIHNASALAAGDAVGSVVGTSQYLSSGTHRNVTIRLDDGVSSGSYVAMPHRDTDGDRVYGFVASGGQADGPYTANGSAVTRAATVTVSASVSMSDQVTDGSSVVVDRVVLSEGGFVTIHDTRLQEGQAFESVLGTSEYLGPGVHTDVRVSLDQNVTEDQTLIPMAHRDTNGNQAYDFVSSDGQEDGPYLNAEGSAVVDTAAVTVQSEASVTFTPKMTGGNVVVVDSVFLPDGGFVTVHDATLRQARPLSSVRGTSEYLGPGLHRNVSVRLDSPLNESGLLIPMAHRDTNDNQTYDFVTSQGVDDGPYVIDGTPVTAEANVTLGATVTYEAQTSDGTTVVVRDVDLSEGGFVTIHGPGLAAGDAVGSVLGTSEYLSAGYHERVVVQLDERITSSQRLVAMPHRDTNGNQQYDFVSSDGQDDAPFVADGSPVVSAATTSVPASVAFANQSLADGTVVVASVTLSEGGFVTIHDSSLLDGDATGSVVGTSEYLPPGTHENVTVSVEGVTESQTLIAMPHLDTNGNQQYDFVSSDGQDDAPYVAAGNAVVAAASVEVTGQQTTTTTTTEEGTTEMAGTSTAPPETPTEGDGGGGVPGFGVPVTLVALLFAALLAARRVGR